MSRTKSYQCIFLVILGSSTLIYGHLKDQGQIGETNGTDSKYSIRQIRATTSIALRVLLKGTKYSATKSGARNYVKYGGYHTAEKDFDLVNFPYVIEETGMKTGIIGDKSFILSRPVSVGNSAHALISIGPISDPHRVEKWIWYRKGNSRI